MFSKETIGFLIVNLKILTSLSMMRLAQCMKLYELEGDSAEFLFSLRYFSTHHEIDQLTTFPLTTYTRTVPVRTCNAERLGALYRFEKLRTSLPTRR